MKYLKHSLFIGIMSLILGLLGYSGYKSLSHGEMYMNRVFSYTGDGTSLFIGEMSRQKIFGFVYIHSYQFHIYTNEINKSESTGFISLSKDIEPSGNLVSFSEEHNYETTTSQFSLIYKISTGSYLKIDSGSLLANFVTKTDPEYFRYMSNGNGNLLINGKQKNTHILSDTVISHNAASAYLKEGTKILGYMGWFWGTQGDSGYFDISEILKKGKGETYESHSYLLSLSRDQKSEKVYGLKIKEEGNNITILHDNGVILTTDKNNMKQIGQGSQHDTYYYFTGEKGDKSDVSGFFNLVK